MRRFGGGNRTEVKERIVVKVKKFFDKYFGIGVNTIDKNYTSYNENNDMVAEDKADYNV